MIDNSKIIEQPKALTPRQGSLTFHDRIINGDALAELAKIPSGIFNMCVTSPPYWALRDYNVEGQLGLEPTFQEYINKLCDIFDEVKRVLKKEGTCWVNMGDTYGSGKGEEGDKKKIHSLEHKRGVEGFQKCLLQIPSRFAIEMCNRGWILRNEIIWHKPNCMPSSVKDRFTVDFEKIFFFVKSKKYYFKTQYEPSEEWNSNKGFNAKNQAIRQSVGTAQSGGTNPRKDEWQQGRNKRCVWHITTKPFKEAHFATFPPELIIPCILAGCPEGGLVLDPFLGSGTTGEVANRLGRYFCGIELNEKYIEIAKRRTGKLDIFLQNQTMSTNDMAHPQEVK